MQGIASVNIELTSRCNKNCHMCARRKRDKETPPTADTYGDIDFKLLKKIAYQIPKGTVVHLHNNGEGLLYPRFGEAVSLFNHCITAITTNGKLLIEKYSEIIGKLDTLAISVIEKDPEADAQFSIIDKFLNIKCDSKPQVILRINGKVNEKRYLALGVPIARRILHVGDRSGYANPPVMPESGICWDFLSHPAIDRHGNLSICVRYDPDGKGILGNLKKETIYNLWNGLKRKRWLMEHIKGNRSEVPGCAGCLYWGIPRGV